MGITITDATPADARDITNVFYKAWLATYPNKELGITVEDIEDSYKDSFSDENVQKAQERIANLPPNRRQLVAKDGDRVVGVVNIIRHDDHNQLRTIYVLPEYHRQGIGTMLWNEAKKFGDPTKETRVQVATCNEQAINFYKKHSFVDTGRRFSDERWRMKSGAIIPEMELVLAAETS
jgi:ribosomal protein S18 acetylase RimI-like enzyme